MDDYLSKKISALSSRVEERLTALEQMVDSINRQMQRIEQTVERINREFKRPL